MFFVFMCLKVFPVFCQRLFIVFKYICLLFRFVCIEKFYILWSDKYFDLFFFVFFIYNYKKLCYLCSASPMRSEIKRAIVLTVYLQQFTVVLYLHHSPWLRIIYSLAPFSFLGISLNCIQWSGRYNHLLS